MSTVTLDPKLTHQGKPVLRQRLRESHSPAALIPTVTMTPDCQQNKKQTRKPKQNQYLKTTVVNISILKT